MEFEKLLKLTMEQKKEVLSDLVKDDVSYWKKITILMAMSSEDDNTELIDMIIEHKVEEINLINKKYGLDIKFSEIANNSKGGLHVSTIEKILNGSNDIKYSKACNEVLEILKHIPVDYYNKINKNFIERLKSNSYKNHELTISEDVEFNSLNILNETKEILGLISDKYWKVNGKKINIVEIFNKEI